MELHREGETMVVRGQVDGRSTYELRHALHEHLRANPRDVVVDISEVESMDLTALRVIAVASRFAAHQHQRMLLRGATPAVRRLLHLTHLRGLVLYDEAHLHA